MYSAYQTCYILSQRHKLGKRQKKKISCINIGSIDHLELDCESSISNKGNETETITTATGNSGDGYQEQRL